MDFTLFAVLPGKLQHEQVRKYANLARAVSHGEKLGAQRASATAPTVTA